jgi:hypothetical protein
MAAPSRRRGRPIKPVDPNETRKITLGLRVLPETKRVVDAMAVRSGRSQSAQAEYLIDRALSFDRLLMALGATMENLERRTPLGQAHCDRAES